MEWKNLNTIQLKATFVQPGTQVLVKELSANLSARNRILKLYGNFGPLYEAKYCTRWNVKHDFPWFPAEHIFINIDFKKKLTETFTRLKSRGLHKEIKTFDGCLMIRKSRGIKAASLHSWALAIDLNASLNPLGGPARFSAAFLQTFREYGLFCGADWKRKDGMHFALFNG